MIWIFIPEIENVSNDLPEGCQLSFPDADKIHEILLQIKPSSGYWKEGTFLFDVSVPLEYNIMVSRFSSQIFKQFYCKYYSPNLSTAPKGDV